MIDHALAVTGRAAIQLNLSHGALVECTQWLYGTPMGDANTNEPNIGYLAPLLELYEHSHIQFHPNVDHTCANACLDAMQAILNHNLQHSGDFDVFGRGNVPTLVDFVTRLDRCNGKGTQMLVDVLVHGVICPLDVAEIIEDTEPVPALAGFFHKVSYAVAIALVHDFNLLAPEHLQLSREEHPKTPDPESPHAYHSRRQGEVLCC